jgi:transcription antitermination factor NusB
MKETIPDNFPLSKTRSIKGSRRLVREKILQILFALEISHESSLNDLYNHIFFRIFRFDDSFEEKGTRVLTTDEVIEIEADYTIDWSEDEKKFGVELMNNTINNRSITDELINKFSQNWEISRIAPIDKIIIAIAITEFTKFPEIPIKVSINEAIELSKQFSTEKSAFFINGLLDSAKNYLKDTDKILKEGKGLLE